jgi:DNA-binding transcriptional regulator YiaG
VAKKTIMKNFGGLNWVTVIGITSKKTKYGEGIEADFLKKIEEQVATFIVQKRVPIRGMEVEFLRKTFGYSLGRIGAELGYSSSAILKWERAKEKRLDKVNEIAMRTWAADRLKLEISGRLSKLVSDSGDQEHVTIKAA